MSIINQLKQAGEIRNQQASKILLECSSLVDNQIKPAKENFLEILDIALQATDFHLREDAIPSESQIVGDIMLKLCSYMYDRSHDDQEAKDLVKELIVLSGRLYANIVLNEPTEKLPKTSEVNSNE